MAFPLAHPPLTSMLALALTCIALSPETLRAETANDATSRQAAAQLPPVPLPEKTPYDADPKARKIYLEEYSAGYRSILAALGGDCHLGVKGPYFEAFQRGWQDGKDAALKAHPEKAAEILGIPWDQYKEIIKKPTATTPRPS